MTKVNSAKQQMHVMTVQFVIYSVFANKSNRSRSVDSVVMFATVRHKLQYLMYWAESTHMDVISIPLNVITSCEFSSKCCSF